MILRTSSNSILRTSSDSVLYMNAITVIKYGLLYNWYAATDAREISSSDDWVLPRWALFGNDDFSQLATFLGGASGAGGKLKETGFDYWNSPNTGALNTVGFNSRGCGNRGSSGFGSQKNQVTYFYDSESDDTDYYRGAVIYYNSASITANTAHLKTYGASIRLINPNTSLSDGESGTYTGNDGKIYSTICIDDIEWLANDLAETKFRNGVIIPWYGASEANYFTNAEWNALSTAGCCAYDNDWTNV